MQLARPCRGGVVLDIAYPEINPEKTAFFIASIRYQKSPPVLSVFLFSIQDVTRFFRAPLGIVLHPRQAALFLSGLSGSFKMRYFTASFGNATFGGCVVQKAGLEPTYTVNGTAPAQNLFFSTQRWVITSPAHFWYFCNCPASFGKGVTENQISTSYFGDAVRGRPELFNIQSLRGDAPG